MRVQRKYKVLKRKTTKEIVEDVNELIRSSGRWQCLDGITFCEKEDRWVQTMVFIQEEAE